MPTTLFSCGSNAFSHLALDHANDVSVLTPTSFHPSVPFDPDNIDVIDVVSASSHSLLLCSIPQSGNDDRRRNILLGVGTNTFGQLGPRCALWKDIKPDGRWKMLDLAPSIEEGKVWEPVKIAATWTTSFIVYRKVYEQHLDRQGSESKINETSMTEMIVSCGSNDFGELGGLIPLILSNTPLPVSISQASQKPTLVDVGLESGETVEFIRGGQRHIVSVINGKTGQRVIGWGASRKGELSVASLSTNQKSQSTTSVKAKGKAKASPYPAISPPKIIPLPIPPGVCIVDLALGASHTLILLSDGTVLGWGSNLKGQIADIHQYHAVKGIAATWGGSYIHTAKGLYSQGSNTHSQLLRDDTAQTSRVEMPAGWEVERIVAGSEHLLVLARKGEEVQLFTGGWNEHGNLALGDQRDRAALTQVDLEKYKVRQLWAGCASTWMLQKT
ncbi:hypothetical protein L204_100084 [Cryptococcus depauperatus]|nr:hypothetical protein L204_02435 [Cryptococcus depauperatus CBS 7855]